MGVEIVKLGVDHLRPGGALPVDDPHGLCHLGPRALAAFTDNPFRVARRGEPVQLVGTVRGRAVGRMLLLPGGIMVGGREYPVVWCSGLYVVPEYRKMLVALALIREARASCVLVGGSRMAEGAFRLFERLGWVGVALNRYVLPCKSRPVLEHLLGSAASSRTLNMVVSRILDLHRRVLEGRARRVVSGLRCEAAESVPKVLDPALTSLSGPYGCHRSSAWLNWILRSSMDPDPRNRKRLFLIYDRNDRVVAYFVNRVKFHDRLSGSRLGGLQVGSVLDWGVFDASALREEHLWLMATNVLIEEGVDAVELCESRDDAGLPFGFRRVGRHQMALLSNAGGPSLTIAPPSGWRLRQIDGDSGLV